MKKSCILLSISLFVTIVLYPLLHETGHIIPLLILGGHIKEITLFPASVLCNVSNLSDNQQIWIAFSGFFLPILISLIPLNSIIILRFANTMLKVLNIYYVLLNIFYLFCFIQSRPLNNTDITIILYSDPKNIPVILLSHILLLVTLIHSLSKNNTLSALLTFYSK